MSKRLYKMLNNHRGDTIVEVIIAMAVLGTAITVAYVSVTHSLQTSTDSGNRDRAVSLNQQQLELVKEAERSNLTLFNTYTDNPGTAFCLSVSDGSKQAANSSTCKNDAGYSITLTYDNSTKAFKADTTWTTGTDQNDSTVYYKPDLGAILGGNPDNVFVSGPPSVNSGSTATINWTLVNVKANSCTATGPGGFGAVNVNTTPPPFTTSALNAPPASATFEIDCFDFANNPVSDSAMVGVIIPTPNPSTSSATSVTYNSATLNGSVDYKGYPSTYCQFWYDTSAYSSSSSLPLHGQSAPCVNGSGQTVSAAISLPNPNITYYFQLCASNSYGTRCSSGDNFKTTLPPAPTITSFSASPNPIVAGGGSTLSWTNGGGQATSCTYGPPNSSLNVNPASTTTYVMTCSGPGGTSASASTTLTVNPARPASCNSTSVSVGGSHRNADNSLVLTAQAGGCSYYNNNYVGPNGGGTWVTPPGQAPGYTFCQNGGVDPWGYYAQSCTWM